MGLRILITNYRLDSHTGTELYVRDIALELRRQGHTPVVYTSWLGKVSDELKAAGITVTDSLKHLDFQPDIIHGHHCYETLSAVIRYPGVPTLFICHDHTQWTDKPPMHPRVIRYFGVSELCIKRLRDSEVPDGKIGQLYNFVDLERFTPRPPLPEKPKTALVFSNYATNETYLPAVEKACNEAGIELTAVGSGVGNPAERPEEILGQYDIVFAKAKAAMEAIAVGCAVILCDFGGVGPMVTTKNFESLRPLNFGFQALTEPHTTENLLRQIDLCNPLDAENVSKHLRSCAGLNHAAKELVDIYQQIIKEYQPAKDTRCFATMLRYRVIYSFLRLWRSIPEERRTAVGLSSIKRAVQSILYRVT